MSLNLFSWYHDIKKFCLGEWGFTTCPLLYGRMVTPPPPSPLRLQGEVISLSNCKFEFWLTLVNLSVYCVQQFLWGTCTNKNYVRNYKCCYYYNTYVEVDAQVWANLISSHSIFRALNFTSGPDLAFKKLAGQTKLYPWLRNNWKICFLFFRT